ncbi:hypothetical protein BVRB_1g016630 [Beta vulgaris subsp. vulgaris]|nr:hypothetical protein BVRB_1g016630 [Beta vulgaris subsp. vulgaris]
MSNSIQTTLIKSITIITHDADGRLNCELAISRIFPIH